MEEIKHGTGYIKDEVDPRDYSYEEKVFGASQLDTAVFEEIDLRDMFMPDAYETQGATNSCTAYSTTRSLEYQINKAFYKKFNTNGFKFNNVISKKFLYYITRYTAAGSTSFSDDGAGFRSVFKSLLRTGSCIQKLHSDLSDISLTPNFEAVVGANDYKINAYYTINTLQGILSSLKLGIPVLIGTNIYGFDDAKNAGGFSAKSLTWNTVFTGNHAMLIVGTKKINNVWHFIIANSYGPTWGDKGYCYISAEKMWNYNLDTAWVIVLDTLVMDLDKENSNYLNSQELPSNSLVVGTYAFNLDYANDPIHRDEIQDKIILSNNNVYVKTATGELINNMTGQPITMANIIATIGNKITYKDIKGVVSTIYLKA